LSPHIVAREAGLPIELVKVDFKNRRTADGQDYLDINPKGYVPALELPDGRVLTEGVAIVQYIADQRPDLGLVPPWSSFQRYRVQEALVFVATELHKNFSWLFHRPSEEIRAIVETRLARRLGEAAAMLGSKVHLFGDEFTVADAYLFTILRWAKATKIDLPTVLQSYVDRVASRPAVQAALEAEGILHSTKG